MLAGKAAPLGPSFIASLSHRESAIWQNGNEWLSGGYYGGHLGALGVRVWVRPLRVLELSGRE